MNLDIFIGIIIGIVFKTILEISENILFHRRMKEIEIELDAITEKCKEKLHEELEQEDEVDHE